ncbi:hypothetical protein Xen7305DRAFT_00007460 [Xenococcus sp. PCC 7305]|uniref:hypothetical protein n=1 Tax=Xenococcus sp. PCC 7305 TaxID=102125 RepID=UPI0002ABF4FA|nr:hypothetical protein [Xenococcus sp. PCC 7305]ELS01045.1 hypothetical protein Xen7305DRAFT_00007460 [Xenococcus sp. PCC 7305]
MNDLLVNLAGWVPAIILPIATITQLVKIVQERNAAGVSLITWFLFGVANIGLYLFTEKYLALQSLVGLLGTAVLDFAIFFLALSYRRQVPAQISSPNTINVEVDQEIV